MNADHALAFLREHQPMPPDRQWTTELADLYRMVCQYFQKYPDTRSIPLILNSFGDGNGLGLYVEADIVLRRFAPEVVIPHLHEALLSRNVSVRRHCLELLPDFANRSLLPLILRSLQSSDLEEQVWAAYALSSVYQPEDRSQIESIVPLLAHTQARTKVAELLSK